MAGGRHASIDRGHVSTNSVPRRVAGLERIASLPPTVATVRLTKASPMPVPSAWPGRASVRNGSSTVS